MQTPNERIKRLNDVQALIAGSKYNHAIKDCGKIVELALKDLYDSAKDEFGNSLEWLEMHKEFEQATGGPFTESKQTLGGLLLLLKVTKLWDLFRIQCESNLEITLNLPWSKVKAWRNKATHENYQFTKDEALEVFQYTKVLLFDTDLIPGHHAISSLNGSLIVKKCHNKECGSDVAEEWKFCPKCGERTYQKCTKCKKVLDPNWAICPFCNLSRDRMRNEDELKHLYKAYCEAIWADLIIVPEERRFLEIKRLEFGLQPEDAKEIEESIIPAKYLSFMGLVEACSLDNQIDESEEIFLLKKAEELKISESSAHQIIENQRRSLLNKNEISVITLTRPKKDE